MTALYYMKVVRGLLGSNLVSHTSGSTVTKIAVVTITLLKIILSTLFSHPKVKIHSVQQLMDLTILTGLV